MLDDITDVPSLSSTTANMRWSSPEVTAKHPPDPSARDLVMLLSLTITVPDVSCIAPPSRLVVESAIELPSSSANVPAPVTKSPPPPRRATELTIWLLRRTTSPPLT
eukprot:7383395-Prymnesium_polylepis.1